MTQTLPKFLQTALCIAAGLAALWLSFRYLLPWLAPFLIAFAAASFLEPGVRRLSRRMPRGAAAGFCTVLTLGGFLSLTGLVAGRTLSELSGAAAHMPQLVDGITGTLTRLENRALALAESMPGGMGRYLQAAVGALPAQLGSLPGWISGKALGLLSAIAEKTPSVLLFVLTTGLGIYFFSAAYPAILRFLARQIPEKHRSTVRFLRKDLLRTLGCWFRAQLILMALTFGELTIALTLLRVDYALLIALLTALIDILPILGAGTVLIPWALVCLLTGGTRLGLGLLITYGAVTLLRNLIQAKLLGDSLGLPPAATLMTMYVGFCAMGVWGMILFPMAAITLKQLNDHGLIRLWNSGVPIAARSPSGEGGAP